MRCGLRIQHRKTGSAARIQSRLRIPTPQGIYAEGIVESDQSSGENINVYPEVPGTVKQILVTEGQSVHRGDPLVLIDDSIQRATAEQLQSQAEAALSLLEELKAQPRQENLDVAEAQVKAAQAMLKTADDALEKQQTAYEMNPRSISKDALDSAINAAAVAKANLAVAKRQYDLTKAGAWVYDIKNQERQYNALQKSYLASSALLSKYTLASAQRRHRPLHQSGRGKLCLYRRALTTAIRKACFRCSYWAAPGCPQCSLLRRRNPGAPAAGSFQDEGANVHPRLQRQARS